MAWWRTTCLPNGELKLLFLSNMQADLLSSRDDATDNILKALEVPSPQLVINLLTSHGFSEYVNKVGVLFPGATDAGLVTERASFASPEEERKAEERIDHFMTDVYAALRKPLRRRVSRGRCPPRCGPSGELLQR